ncbi:lipid-binding SYLF domain-containing protein [Petrachloros mirabilis]
MNPVPTGAADSPQQELVDQARATVEVFTADSEMREALRELGPQARALFIVPDFARWGFVVGGGGGKGVLIVRELRTGFWSQPIFYNVSSLTVGAQVGADVSEIIVVVISEKGVEDFYGGEFKLGAGTGLAKGPSGKGTSVHGLDADMLAYARNKGVFGGIAVGGALINIAEDANNHYYGEPTTPRDIVEGKVGNPRSLDLRNAASKLIKQ